MNFKNGKFFTATIMNKVKSKFLNVDFDIDGKDRLFLDNAGGSFRLKKVLQTYMEISSIPDNPERLNNTAQYLQKLQLQAEEDFKMMLNVQGGTVYTSLTASKAMFEMVRVICENISGTNMVTTILEHPSSYDAMELYAMRTNRELRVAKSNIKTGGIDVDEIVKLIDKNTTLLSVMYASNISGAKLNIKKIVKKARMIKPDLYILIDAVQHAPHDIIDLKKIAVDGVNIAPYKFFGCRGMGLSWLSSRAACLAHDKLNGKAKDCWDIGSSTPALYAMFSEIINYICKLGSYETKKQDKRAIFTKGMEMIALHERALLSRLLNGSKKIQGLRKMKNLTVYLDYKDLTKRDLILAINFKNIDPEVAVKRYAKHGVIVFQRLKTNIYSQRMLESFDIDGMIRVSPLHCHSIVDIDKFLTITKKLSKEI